MRNRFSKRLGYRSAAKPITTRDDAPMGLREFIIQLVYDCKYKPSTIRDIICRVLRVRPDNNNWSEFPNIDGEVNQLLMDCEWYMVYDVIEGIWDSMDTLQREGFQTELNDFFLETGIGWKLEYGQIEFRGDENFESSIKNVESALTVANLSTAKTEIKEAIQDLSRRPVPDITGAIQHSLACLECVTREATGDKRATLGELMKKFPNIIPKPLDQAIEKIWGFSSEQGRHLKEGFPPQYDEAELLVGVSAAISTYLAKKIPICEPDKGDLPF